MLTLSLARVSLLMGLSGTESDTNTVGVLGGKGFKTTGTACVGAVALSRRVVAVAVAKFAEVGFVRGSLCFQGMKLGLVSASTRLPFGGGQARWGRRVRVWNGVAAELFAKISANTQRGGALATHPASHFATL